MSHVDDKWVRQAQSGSRKAYEKLVKKYTDALFRFVYDIVRNYQDAEDITQETFVRGFININQFRFESRFSTWLYRIAYHAGLDLCKKRKRFIPVDFQENKKVKKMLTVQDASYTGLHEAIEDALMTLTEHQRLALILHHYHGFKMKEISDILGCAESTVRVHLFRAIDKMKKKLENYRTKD